MSALVGRVGYGAAAIGLLAVDAAVRVALGRPYVGATFLLLTACGLALLPFVPRELGTPSRRLAVLPALAIAALSILLTTTSIVGVALTESTTRVAVGVLVLSAVVASLLVRPIASGQLPRSPARAEALAVAMLVGLFLFSVAASWDIVYPLQARGIDLWHYLLYAEEVADQQRLLIDDPYAGEAGRIFADPPAVGALYGSFLVLDGISSLTLAFGLVIASAVSVLSVYVAAGTLWGIGAGVVAAGAYAVAPIRLDLMYWYGLGTALALVFLPLVVLCLGLMFRGQRDWRTTALLALSLAAVAASHSTTAIVVAMLVAIAPLVDLVRWWSADRRCDGWLRSWWRKGVIRPVLVATAAAVVLGAGVIVHLAAQAADLGRPVDYRLLGPDWLDRAAIEGYYAWPFLVVTCVAVVLLLMSRYRGDSALLAVVALAFACLVVSQLWRVHFPFEYRRSVYYLGIAMVLVIGVAFLRFRPRPIWLVVCAIAIIYVSQQSIGLRLPQRVLAGSEQMSTTLSLLVTFRDRLDSGALQESPRFVTDGCTLFVVPYLTRRPTLTAYGARQVGFENRVALAEKASTVLEGGLEGRRLAARLGVRYAVADPRCTPDLPSRLGAPAIVETDELVVVQLPSASQ